jgi:hypothetical protein
MITSRTYVAVSNRIPYRVYGVMGRVYTSVPEEQTSKQTHCLNGSVAEVDDVATALTMLTPTPNLRTTP